MDQFYRKVQEGGGYGGLMFLGGRSGVMIGDWYNKRKYLQISDLQRLVSLNLRIKGSSVLHLMHKLYT